MKIIKPNLNAIQQAAEALRKGHLVAIPTETVYGLAGDATNDRSIAKIYQTKGRPQFNPLIVHVESIVQAKKYVEFNEIAENLAQQFWPGPLTLVLPMKKDAGLSRLVTAGLETVAIRCPANEIALDLIRVSGCPLAAPSANPSTRISPTCARHVYEGFQGLEEPVFILDGGQCSVGLESTVLDLTEEPPVLLRPGGLPLSALSDYNIRAVQQDEKIKSPGMMLKHYAPRHPLRMNAKEVDEGEILLAFGPNPLKGAKEVFNLSPESNDVEAAANLFSMLHEIDQKDCTGIAVMLIPEDGLGAAINDRLKRASHP